LLFLFFFLWYFEPILGDGSRSHSLDKSHLVGLLWTNDSPTQRPLPDNTQHSQETGINAALVIRTRNPSIKYVFWVIHASQLSVQSPPQSYLVQSRVHSTTNWFSLALRSEFYIYIKHLANNNVFLILWHSPKVAVDYAAHPKRCPGKWQTEGFCVFRRPFWRSWGSTLKQPLLLSSTPFRCHGYRLSRLLSP